jgi:hypothetical protein
MRIAELFENWRLQEYRPAANSHVIMVTGRLARAGLTRMMAAIAPDDFTYEIRVLDIQVAAWLTAEQIIKEIKDVSNADVILVPGKTQGNTEDIERALGIQVLRGPSCYSELPVFFEETGFEDQVSDVPRPRLLIIGKYANRISEFLASTYQVPLITPEKLAQQAVQDGLDVPDPYQHNVMAELLRARMLDSDAKKGYVISEYPRNERDVLWLQSLKVKPDGILIVGRTDPDLINAYQNHPGKIMISTSLNERDMQATALERIEIMMQQCIVPDLGAAPRDKDI